MSRLHVAHILYSILQVFGTSYKMGKNNEIIMSFEYHSSAGKNTTVNNILNTLGKSHDGLKPCQKLILTVLFLIFLTLKKYIYIYYMQPYFILVYYT